MMLPRFQQPWITNYLLFKHRNHLLTKYKKKIGTIKYKVRRAHANYHGSSGFACLSFFKTGLPKFHLFIVWVFLQIQRARVLQKNGFSKTKYFAQKIIVIKIYIM